MVERKWLVENDLRNEIEWDFFFVRTKYEDIPPPSPYLFWLCARPHSRENQKLTRSTAGVFATCFCYLHGVLHVGISGLLRAEFVAAGGVGDLFFCCHGSEGAGDV